MGVLVVGGSGGVLGGVFRLASRLRRGDDARPRVAVPMLVEKVSCPLCGSFYSVLVLGLLARRVDRRLFVTSPAGGKAPNPAFRETHLANPVVCPSCGRRYYVFVGVEYDRREGIRDVDVVPLPEGEEGVEELVQWPLRGLVLEEAVKYTPFKVEVYDSLDALLEAVEPNIGAASLPSIAPQGGEQPRGDRGPAPRRVIQLSAPRESRT